MAWLQKWFNQTAFEVKVSMGNWIPLFYMDVIIIYVLILV